MAAECWGAEVEPNQMGGVSQSTRRWLPFWSGDVDALVSLSSVGGRGGWWKPVWAGLSPSCTITVGGDEDRGWW